MWPLPQKAWHYGSATTISSMLMPWDTAKVIIVGGGFWLVLSLAILVAFGSAFRITSAPRPPWQLWMIFAVLCFFCLLLAARVVNRGDFYHPQKSVSDSAKH
jgi:hypothetical protein